jgi:release factor glutamine methyltransferase
MTTIGQWLRDACDESTRRDYEVLIAHALETNRAHLYAHANDPLPAARDARIRDLIEARRRGAPVAYLVGRREFWTFDLAVTPAVLIPRPETELLVELALERLPRGARVLDLGTGSGAIALAIRRERPDCTVIATDASTDALAIARRNADALALVIETRIGDWFAAVADEPPFDAIVSNPPYVAAADPHLESLVGEPIVALVAGADGLAALRTIIAEAPAHLSPNGTLLVEHAFDQGDAVRALFRAARFTTVETHRDGAGHERATLGTR